MHVCTFIIMKKKNSLQSRISVNEKLDVFCIFSFANYVRTMTLINVTSLKIKSINWLHDDEAAVRSY